MKVPALALGRPVVTGSNSAVGRQMRCFAVSIPMVRPRKAHWAPIQIRIKRASTDLWARDALALKAKSDFNKEAGTPDQTKAMSEVRLELKRISAWPNYLANTIVIAFVIAACADALIILNFVKSDPLHPYVFAIIVVFMIFFLFLSILLVLTGTRAVCAIGHDIAVLESTNKL